MKTLKDRIVKCIYHRRGKGRVTLRRLSWALFNKGDARTRYDKEGRIVREAITNLRLSGCPICSDTHGYWWEPNKHKYAAWCETRKDHFRRGLKLYARIERATANKLARQRRLK